MTVVHLRLHRYGMLYLKYRRYWERLIVLVQKIEERKWYSAIMFPSGLSLNSRTPEPQSFLEQSGTAWMSLDASVFQNPCLGPAKSPTFHRRLCPIFIWGLRSSCCNAMNSLLFRHTRCRKRYEHDASLILLFYLCERHLNFMFTKYYSYCSRIYLSVVGS